MSVNGADGPNYHKVQQHTYKQIQVVSQQSQLSTTSVREPPSSHRFFPLPLVPLSLSPSFPLTHSSPADPSHVSSSAARRSPLYNSKSRSTQQRWSFNRLSHQLTNLTITGCNILADSIQQGKALHHLHLLNRTLHTRRHENTQQAVVADVHVHAPSPSLSSSIISDASSSQSRVSPVNLGATSRTTHTHNMHNTHHNHHDHTAATNPLSVTTQSVPLSHTLHSVISHAIPDPMIPVHDASSVSTPSPCTSSQLRAHHHLSSTCRHFAHQCHAVRSATPTPTPSAVLADSVSHSSVTLTQPVMVVKAATNTTHTNSSSGLTLLRQLCAYTHTYVKHAHQRASNSTQLQLNAHPGNPHLHSSPTSSSDTSSASSVHRLDSFDPHSASSPGYHSMTPVPIVPLMATRIALPSELNYRPLLELLPPDIALNYVLPANHLRDAAEIEALNLSHPLPPPRVSGARSEYVALLIRMKAAGMISFTAHPRAVNGVFSVHKDATSDRLIIDAQPANRLLVDSPHVRLPNPSHLVQLHVPPQRKLYCAKSDLSNFYHQLRLPAAWQPYFALPHLSTEECQQLGCDSTQPYPMCTTLPMGFSHAVYLAQAVHEHVLYSTGALRPCDSVLNLDSPLVDRCLHAAYIDDLLLLGTDYHQVLTAYNACIQAYMTFGLPVSVKKLEPPSLKLPPVKAIGVTIDGRTLTLFIAAEDRLKLISSTLAVLHSPTVTGLQLSQLIGSWTWCLMLRRPALSILRHVYRYIIVADKLPFTLWPSVRTELVCLLAMVTLLHTSMAAPFFHHAYASDASELAAGVVTTPLTHALARALYPLSSNPSVNLLPLQRALGPDGDSQLPAEFLQYMEDIGSELHESVTLAPWATIVSQRWRHMQHINALELHAALLAVRHAITHPDCISSRVFSLVDSSVVYYALWKGRSSSSRLLPVLRQLASMLLATGMTLQPCWIPSALNPADKPSREVTVRHSNNNMSQAYTAHTHDTRDTIWNDTGDGLSDNDSTVSCDSWLSDTE